MAHPSLRVESGFLTHRVLLEHGRAVGVVGEQNGEPVTVRAGREVVLSGGVSGSAQLLLLSAIGPADELAALGIEIVADLPGVGRSLHDHPDLSVKQRCTRPVSLFQQLKPLARLRIGPRWLLFKDGRDATNHDDTAAFLRSGEEVEHPDLMLSFAPIAIDCEPIQSINTYPFDGFQTHADLLRPTSRGRLWLADADPRHPPRCAFNDLETEHDRRVLHEAVRIIRAIHAQPAFDPYRGPDLQPGEALRSDAEIDDWIRRTVETGYHPVGTCAIGAAEDQAAVVCPQCRVRGVSARRVVDASIMPRAVSSNTSAATIMIAEEASGLILGWSPAVPAADPALAA